MPEEIAILLFVLIVYLIYKYFWVIGFIVFTILAVVIIVKGNKRRKNEIDKEKNERQRKINREIELEAQAKRQKAGAERLARLREEEEARFQQALRSGKDVCWNCKTVEPKRCRCGKCIASYKCHDYYRSNGECKECYWKCRRRKYE
jgi:hypothetical protein